MRDRKDEPVSGIEYARYLPGNILLSSEKTDWQHLLFRLCQEPIKQEEMLFPGSKDIYLVLIHQGAVQVDERDLYGPWTRSILHAGDWFLSPANGDPYALRWQSLGKTPLQSIQIHLSADLFLDMTQQMLDQDPTSLNIEERTGFQDPLLTQLASSLQQELETTTIQPTSPLYADTAAQMLIAHLIRNYIGKPAKLATNHRRLTTQQLQLLQSFIHDHLAQPLSLVQLAQQIGFSPYHFARLFRQSTGKSPHQFVLQKRLQQAQHLLKTTNKPLTEIALDTGFHNQSHFTQTFRHHLGLTPSHYRLLG